MGAKARADSATLTVAPRGARARVAGRPDNITCADVLPAGDPNAIEVCVEGCVGLAWTIMCYGNAPAETRPAG